MLSITKPRASIHPYDALSKTLVSCTELLEIIDTVDREYRKLVINYIPPLYL